MMNRQERLQLLHVARASIRMHLLDNRLRLTREDFPEEKFWQPRGVFVTLTEGGELRGCIGTILPVSPLVEAVCTNAVAAAFEDPRFDPVEEQEFAGLRIELSLLTVPTQLAFTSPEDLRGQLAATHPGVILRRGGYQATFLPQVWEELPDVDLFLEQLCRKAGLPVSALSGQGLQVFTYTVEAFSEQPAE